MDAADSTGDRPWISPIPTRSQALQDKLRGFMDEHVYPNEARHAREIETGDRWQPTR